MTFIRKHIEYILVFLLSCAFSVSNIASLCRNYAVINFDTQAFINWRYAGALDLLPYKEIYYPYGILSFYRGQNLLFEVAYLLLTPLLLLAFFIVFKAILKKSLLVYPSYLLLMVFVATKTGFETFSRYGAITALSFLYAYVIVNKPSALRIGLLGVVTGLFFSVYSDQGIYAAVLFVMLLLSSLVLEKSAISSLFKYFTRLVVFLIGSFIGVLPFILYINSINSLGDFYYFLKGLSDNALFAKTAFFHSIATPDNLFTLFVLFAAIYYLSNYFILKKSQPDFKSFTLLGLVFVIVILEQKNIIRSIDTQITFISLVVILLLFKEFLGSIGRLGQSKLFVMFCFMFMFLMTISLFGSAELSPTKFNLFSNKLINLKNPNACLEFENLPEGISKYQSDLKQIERVVNTKNTFVYPDDKIFYLLMNQKPFFYPSIYEATPLYSQVRMIDEINNRGTKHVIYNYKNFAVQDGVPNYIRGSFINRFLLNNFQFKKRIGDYVVLEKDQDTRDVFTDKNFPDDFVASLLNINLESIPESEGLHKESNLLGTGNVLIKSVSNTQFNQFLKSNKISSSNKFLLVTGSSNNPSTEYAEIVFKTKDGIKSTVRFRSCKLGKSCLINLARLPHFYRDRTVTSITINSDGDYNFTLVELEDEKPLW